LLQKLLLQAQLHEQQQEQLCLQQQIRKTRFINGISSNELAL